MEAPVISVIVPCYNEQQVLPFAIPKLLSQLKMMIENNTVSNNSFILCCDDGSNDNTWQLIEQYHIIDSHIKGLSLNSNRGHQNVLMAGIMHVKDKCDAAITIDADLQDDPDAIVQMIEEFKHGSEVVYGIRQSRRADSLIKRITSKCYYSMQKLFGLESVANHADCRLLSRYAMECLSQYSEQNIYLRGIIAQMGLKSSKVYYNRLARIAGKSKYTIGKMLDLAIDGITSFTSRPLRIIFITGLLLLLLDIIMSIYVFLSYFGHNVIPGWTSLMLSLWFLGSLILIGIGVVGEYVGKIYVEVKHRPRYQIKQVLE
ncbi:MAG: glycosyltransferase family 2 protein [Paramuribaculum sp.]|nr:glycosyltransferase family 2 protein [Paramuribaculum sp.]